MSFHRKSLPRWAIFLVGDPRTTGLRSLILNLAMFAALVLGLYFLVTDPFLGPTEHRTLFDLIIVIAFGVLYFLARFRNHYVGVAHAATWFSLAFCTLNFFMNSGMHGPTLLLVLMLCTFMGIFHSFGVGLGYTAIALALMGFCLWYQSVFPSAIPVYASGEAQVIDLAVTFSFCAILCSFVIGMVLWFFDEVLEGTRRAQLATMQSEKMASLGALLAALNHEINTPVAIIGSTLSMADGWWKDELPRLGSLLPPLTPDQHWVFLEFLRRGIESDHPRDIDSRTHRARRERLVQALAFLPPHEARFWADEWETGLDPGDPLWRPLFADEQGQAALKWALRLFSHRQSHQSASLAYDKLQNLMGALSSYARTEPPGAEPTTIPLTEGIETVLTLYGVARKHEVDIVREYTASPWVRGNADELIQVWTNLIQNAVQAMGPRGVLTLGLAEQGDWAVVTVSDTGPGVPPALREKIFEPFFTTKNRGEGTGLGLGIVRQILQAHGGTIDVGDAPGGGARFTVKLPLLRSPQTESMA